MYLRIYPEDLKNPEAIGDVSKILVGSVNGTVCLNGWPEEYVSMAGENKEIKIGIKAVSKFLKV